MSTDDDSLSLNECIRELFDERSGACDYYRSGDYWRHLDKALELYRKMEKRLGKEQWKKISWCISGIDEIHGEQLAGLQESSYKRGFNDALILVGELERAKNGLPTIFN